MKNFFRFTFIIILGCLVMLAVFHFTGNPFEALMLYKTAKEKSEKYYGDSLRIGAPEYCNEEHCYKIELTDGDGISDYICYDPEQNRYKDCYGETQRTVTKYLLRGKLINDLGNNGVYPSDMYITFSYTPANAGMENGNGKIKTASFKSEAADENEFTEFIMKTFDTVKKYSIENISFEAGKMFADFTKDNIPRKSEDIKRRIKTKE